MKTLRKVGEPPTLSAATLADDLQSILQGLAETGAGSSVATIGVVLGRTPPQALSYAEQRAGDLVGMKLVSGKWVPNPDSQWQIAESLRASVKTTTQLAVKEGWSPQKLTQVLRDQLTGPPGKESWRAQTIARTETGLAYNAGTAAGYEEAGVELVEILDGEGCLPVGHKDGAPKPVKGKVGIQPDHQANGQIWTVAEFNEHKLGHPNCVRAGVPYFDPNAPPPQPKAQPAPEPVVQPAPAPYKPEIQPVSYAPRPTLKEAQQWASEHSAPRFQTQATKAASDYTDNLLSWKKLSDKRRLAEGLDIMEQLDPEDITKNWTKLIRTGKPGKLPVDFKLDVQNAINTNSQNATYQKWVARSPGENVVASNYMDPRYGSQTGAAEAKGGTAFMYNHGFRKYETALNPGTRPKTGATTSTNWGGMPAELRHEFAHHIRDFAVSTEDQRAWNDLVGKIGPKKIEEGLTHYATTNRSETFSELFALITEPGYVRQDFPEYIGEMQDLMEEILERSLPA